MTFRFGTTKRDTNMWLLFLGLKRVLFSRRIRDTDRVVEAKLRFQASNVSEWVSSFSHDVCLLDSQVSRPGKHSLTVHALCDSYVGIDQKAQLIREQPHELQHLLRKVDLNFHVHTEEEARHGFQRC